MKYSVLILILTGILINGCQTEITCESQLLQAVNQENLLSDSIQSIIIDCGKLDPVDIQISQTPLFTEIVNIEDFSNGKYDANRFVTDFQKFKKTDKYTILRSSLILQTKKYKAEDWNIDKEGLTRMYSLSPEDLELLKSVVTNPANSSMTYPEAYKEMNKIKVQNVLDRMQKEKSAE